MDPASPQQLNGYAYASNNPITNSDPSGLWNVPPDYETGETSPPPAPGVPSGAGSGPSKSSKTTLTIIGSKGCTTQSYFVGERDKPWQGYMITGSGTEYTAIVHDSGGCYDGAGRPIAMGPCNVKGSDFLVTWLEADTVTARRYDCKKSGHVNGCVYAVAKPGPQSFGEDLKDIAKGIYQLSGAADVVDCAVGSHSGESCAWAAAAIVPFGLGKAAKVLGASAKGGEESLRAAAHGAAAANVGNPAAKGGVYTLRDVDGNVARTGRTNDLARREREHGRHASTEDFSFQVEYRTDVYGEQRGLEQIIWITNGRPTLSGVRRTSPVDVTNKNYNNYMGAAGQFFGTWFPG